jgi:Na+/H+ antiporter NhaD/arsenite permease-like protein
LLVGYLRGVPFFWPLTHLLLPLLLLAVPVLALTFGLDVWLARKESRPRREKLRIRGLLNIVLLLVLISVIPLEGVWHPGDVTVLSSTVPVEQMVVMLVEIGCILVSELFTPKAIRSQNRFAWRAMREIVILFFAIFATIGPAFTLLQAEHIPPLPLAWFWASGLASAVLDAAPTYLIFFEAAGGHAAALTQGSAPLLTALAAGSVFFGPLTYLGNAPNLMIREIAARRGVRMPGFFAFAGIMALVLMPIYALMSVVFF